MALKIAKGSNCGVDAEYWMFSHFERLSFKHKEYVGVFYGFPSQKIRQGTFRVDGRDFSNSPVAQMRLEVAGTDFDLDYDDNVTKKMYEKLKKLHDWKGAEDV